MSDVITIKDLAYQAIAKHSCRVLKHEAGVLLDNDPEDTHQMRVGIRHLRSTISSFALAIYLPDIFISENIAKIGHSLGKLRDLDVLLDVLSNNYRSKLPNKEQKSLNRVTNSLEKQRKRELKQVSKTLNSKLYLNLKQELNSWLEQPKYQISRAKFSWRSP